MDHFATVTVDIDGPLAKVVLNRPEARNGMTNRMVRETYEALSNISAMDDVRVVVLTGAGNSFCPGADLNSIGQRNDDPLEYCEQTHYQVPVLLHNMPQLTIAAINGACAGAGFGWACGCDLRFAKASAMFNTAFINVAVAGDMGLPWSLPRLVGSSKARELSFLCEKFDAAEAHRIGLIARVFADEDFETHSKHLIDTLLARSPTALKTMKSHYLAAEGVPMEHLVALETERHQHIATGKHAAEAFKAFVEKRKPVFD